MEEEQGEQAPVQSEEQNEDQQQISPEQQLGEGEAGQEGQDVIDNVQDEAQLGEDQTAVSVRDVDFKDIDPDFSQTQMPDDIKKPVRKDLIFRPAYDNEPLFTNVSNTQKVKKRKNNEVQTTIGELRMESGTDMLALGKLKKSTSLIFGDIDASNKSSIQSSIAVSIDDLIRPRSPQTDFYKSSIKYLMTLIPSWGDGEMEEMPEEPPKKEEEVVEYEEETEIQETGTTESMRQAQRYLRVHKIFEFLQFLTSHLLGARPDNPIDYLLDLLDRCLIYRAGYSDPPVLYSKKHIGCLFNLMDRMRTGFITLEQYKTGMNTLGICSFNENPPVNTENLVSKNFFVEEAYDSLCKLLDDLLRRRWLKEKPPAKLESVVYLRTKLKYK